MNGNPHYQSDSPMRARAVQEARQAADSGCVNCGGALRPDGLCSECFRPSRIDRAAAEHGRCYVPDGDSPFDSAFSAYIGGRFKPADYDLSALDELASCARALLARPVHEHDQGLYCFARDCEAEVTARASREHADPATFSDPPSEPKADSSVGLSVRTLTVKSSQLRQGDIVHCHGMRVLLDAPIQSAPTSGLLPVYWCAGLVLNRADVPAFSVPYSFTLQSTGYPEFKPTGEHRWSVQGNDLSHWLIERADHQPADSSARGEDGDSLSGWGI